MVEFAVAPRGLAGAVPFAHEVQCGGLVEAEPVEEAGDSDERGVVPAGPGDGWWDTGKPSPGSVNGGGSHVVVVR